MISMDMYIEHHDNHHDQDFHHLPLCAAGKSESKSKTCHNHLNIITIITMMMMMVMITMITMMILKQCWLNFQDNRC